MTIHVTANRSIYPYRVYSYNRVYLMFTTKSVYHIMHSSFDYTSCVLISCMPASFKPSAWIASNIQILRPEGAARDTYKWLQTRFVV